MHINVAMEEELKCPVCHKLFIDPVILPCTHNLCAKCAETLKSKSGNIGDVSPEYFARTGLEFDKVSLLSEAVFSDTDSGYSGGSLGSNSSEKGRTISLTPVGAGSQGQPSSPVSHFPKSWNQTQGVHLPSLPESISCLTCPICQRTVFLDDRGVNGLTQNILMLNIIRKFESRTGLNPVCAPKHQPTPNGIQGRIDCQKQATKALGAADLTHATDNAKPIDQSQQISASVPEELRVVAMPKCEMCEDGNQAEANVRCEQCSVLYCESCRQRYHPARGPLASHTLCEITPNSSQNDVSTRLRRTSERTDVVIDPQGHDDKKTLSPGKRRSQSAPPSKNGRPEKTKSVCSNGIYLSPCSFHIVENISMYCELCQVPLCYQCLEDGRHREHEVKAIGATYKSHKADLSHQMGALSNKARQAKDLVMHLRCVQEDIQKNSIEFESRIVAQCNALMEAVNQKKHELIQRVAAEREVKGKMVREQLQQCTMKLKQTTGLLEYCIEVMKDNDPAPFMQVSSGLIKRVASTEQQWTEHHLAPRAKSDFNFDLDATPLLQAMENFNITQRRAPDRPVIKIAECSSNNNTVTLSWMVKQRTAIDGFTLELDDGANGKFREVYRGKETVCTVDGLHFNSVYKARVRAYNRSGRSQHSETVQLQTSEVAVFHMDPMQAHSDVKLSNNYCTVNCISTENRVVLGNIGFSKGTHYWEYSVDRYDSSNPDVVFGVARNKVDKSCILGKDKYGWSMYIDNSRTWFFHNDEHTNRHDGGVDVGSRLGVLLEIEKNQVTFYVNQKQRGKPMSLDDDNMGGRSSGRIFYPALGLNRQAQVTLWPGLRHPVQIRPSLYHSRSFNVASSSGLCKNRVASRYGALNNGGNSNSVPRCGKQPPSPTSTFQNQKRSQSSDDIKSQQGGLNQRLYNSLPSQPVVQMASSSTISSRSDCSQPSDENAVAGEKVEQDRLSGPEKPALKRKPPQLVNAIQEARFRQNRLASFKTPPQPPVRRGSTSSSSTVSSSTKSDGGDAPPSGSVLTTFQ